MEIEEDTPMKDDPILRLAVFEAMKVKITNNHNLFLHYFKFLRRMRKISNFHQNEEKNLKLF